MPFKSLSFSALSISAVLHGALLVLVAWGWESAPEIKSFEQPKFIEAKLLKMESTAPKETNTKPRPPVIDLTKRREEERRRKEIEQRKKAEEAAKSLVKEGMHISIVNPTRVYGPGLMSDSNGVTKMIKLFIKGKLAIVR